MLALNSSRGKIRYCLTNKTFHNQDPYLSFGFYLFFTLVLPNFSSSKTSDGLAQRVSSAPFPLPDISPLALFKPQFLFPLPCQ